VRERCARGAAALVNEAARWRRQRATLRRRQRLDEAL
jgi:hypothetical protein